MLPIVSILIGGLLVFGYFSIRGLIFGYFLIQKDKRKQYYYLQPFLCKEDFASQMLFLFSVSFFGIALFAINKQIVHPFSLLTIIFFTSLIGLAISYYFKVTSPLALSLIGLIFWWTHKALVWGYEKNIKITAILSGILYLALIFYLLSRLHEKNLKFKRFSIVYFILSFIAIFGIPFLFSTKLGLEILEEIAEGNPFFASWQITLSLILFFVTSLILLVYALISNLIFHSEATALGILMILAFIFNFISDGIFWALIFNVLAFFELIGIIFLGYLKKEEWLVNFGAFFILIFVFVKYFDLLFKSLDKSVFFIGAGILLLAFGWIMEKGKKHLISKISKTQI